ncbi:linear amide C-N hydrolase [Marinomonas sp. THO17]|uniref:linear amide C-N hydrolase n=1 Tax=Marinomonas sp. THO17 TaxID=3149048 RepID=UPI00336BDCAB
MCTRIVNNIDTDWVTTARNFDWEFPLSSSIFRSPTGLERIGLSTAEIEKYNLQSHQVLTWQVKYSSISILIGTEEDGYGTTDGMNTEGLTANILYDATTTLNNHIAEGQKALSLIRWGQFVLDAFASVQEVVTYFKTQTVFFVSGTVPGDPTADTELYLTISDKIGDSAILGIKEGKIEIHHSKQYSVATNQPDYQTQLNMMNYWLFQWNLKSAGAINNTPSYTVPGGNTAVQRFQRACYYRLLTGVAKGFVDRVAQVKTMVGTCSVPTLCSTFGSISSNNTIHTQSEDDIPTTLWSSISDAANLKYYFFDELHVGAVWFDVAIEATECAIWLISDSIKGPGFKNNGDQMLKPCDDIYAYYC